jgi:antitoxin ParD1/3/4
MAIFVQISQRIMNVSLTPKQQQYIAEQVASGDFQNASELVRDALRIHQLMRSRILAELREEIAKGWDGPTSARSVKDIIAAQRDRNA